MKLGKTKNGENISCLKVVEDALVQCNLVDYQYQQKSEVFYTFNPNKSFGYLLNVEPINLVLLETYNIEFYGIIKAFMNQNNIPLETEDKVNLALLINI